MTVMVTDGDDCQSVITSDPPYDQDTLKAIVLLNTSIDLTCSGSSQSDPMIIINGTRPIALNNRMEVDEYSAQGITWSNIINEGEGEQSINITVRPPYVDNRTNISCVFGCATDVIQIIPVKGVPPPPDQLDGVILGPHTLRLSWNPPWPYPVHNYTLYINGSSSFGKMSNTTNTVFTVNVTPSDEAAAAGDVCNQFKFSVRAHTSVGSTNWSNTTIIGIPIDIDSLDESFLRNISNIYETSTGFKIEMEPLPNCSAGSYQYFITVVTISQNTTTVKPSSGWVDPLMFMFSMRDLIMESPTCNNTDSYDWNSFDVFINITALNKEMTVYQSIITLLYPNTSFQCIDDDSSSSTDVLLNSSDTLCTTSSAVRFQHSGPGVSLYSTLTSSPFIVTPSTTPITTNIPLMVSIAVLGVFLIAMVTVGMMMLVYIINKNRKGRRSGRYNVSQNAVANLSLAIPPERMTVNDQYILDLNTGHNHIYDEIKNIDVPSPIPIPPVRDSVLLDNSNGVSAVMNGKAMLSADNHCSDDFDDKSPGPGSEDYVEMHKAKI